MKVTCWRWLQALERLSLLWPDGKLTLPRVEQAVNDAAHFTPFHWVDALLMGKSKRALHILQQLRLEGNEPVILLRTLQRELLLLVNLKRQSAHTPLRALFDKHRVWQNRRGMMGEALNRLSQPAVTSGRATPDTNGTHPQTRLQSVSVGRVGRVISSVVP